MNKKKLFKIVRIIACSLLCLVLLLVMACRYVGIHSRSDFIAYLGILHEDVHPIWKDLALKRINKGDSVVSLLERYKPKYQEDFPPYKNLIFGKKGSFTGLGIITKDDVLIRASVGSCEWQKIFFDSPAEANEINRVYGNYIEQRRLESETFGIYMAVELDQDVFISNQVTTRMVPNPEPPPSPDDWWKHYEPNKPQITAEVSELVHGDLEVGTSLVFRGDECGEIEPNDLPLVFTRYSDSRTRYPYSDGGEVVLSYPHAALKRYYALEEEQMDRFKVRLADWKTKQQEILNENKGHQGAIDAAAHRD